MAGADLGQFVDGDDEGHRVEAGAAKILGPWNTEQSQVSHLRDVLPREGGVGVVLCGNGADMVVREGANHFAHLQVLLIEVQRVVHWISVGGSHMRAPVE